MKKLFLSLFLFIPVSVFANDEQIITPNTDIIINQNYYPHGKNIPAFIDVQNKTYDTSEEIKHLPWSFTEKRIEYDHNGHAQFQPYALNDLNIQY